MVPVQIRESGRSSTRAVFQRTDRGEIVTKTAGCPHIPEKALGRLAHIRINQQSAPAQHGKADGDIGGCQALTLRRIGACDSENPTDAPAVLRHAEHQTGAQFDVGFLNGKRGFVVEQALPVVDQDFTGCQGDAFPERQDSHSDLPSLLLISSTRICLPALLSSGFLPAP